MGFKKFCKKICKEICRPFRQASRGMGRLARHVGGKKFGDFIERALNIAIDAALNVGSATFGGPAGVAAINALLAASYNLSDNDHATYDKPSVATQGYHVETIKIPIGKSTNVVIGAGHKGFNLNGEDNIGVAILSHETGSIACNISDNVSFNAAKIQIKQEVGEKTSIVVSGETKTTPTHTHASNTGKVIVEHNINDKTRIQLSGIIQDNQNYYTNKESCLSIDHTLGELSSIGGKICHKNSPYSDRGGTEFEANMRINF